ncbi:MULTISPECIES: Nif11-like leader peptide family natural product precursor [Planktothricoides]|uniref:Nif11-like leader peptide family natural product n=2 Tax=Planktothricoides raciborskii TaxID=132608 RepID=A0AAU8JF66_9CYAN|nr:MULTISPECIES: Nif11-like leader peptide family natural product precursor [Planktothricoides]KOR35489.1 bacteriocin [Planktothricoides sp. SR001]MBD2545202.1 Nif11-like leader peptide family natural product precursor [Planktothricoides raciborskii FACHB-1370]MBD2583269.1 Nif11-like leader peptide family natural product precursor [Planktothricoides raciborskii FACHB-1261]
MEQTNAAKLYTAVQEQQALSEQKEAAENIQAFIEMAEQRGYHYTEEEIKSELSHLSEEELASLQNPGVGPRHHLLPR